MELSPVELVTIRTAVSRALLRSPGFKKSAEYTNFAVREAVASGEAFKRITDFKGVDVPTLIAYENAYKNYTYGIPIQLHNGVTVRVDMPNLPEMFKTYIGPRDTHMAHHIEEYRAYTEIISRIIDGVIRKREFEISTEDLPSLSQSIAEYMNALGEKIDSQRINSSTGAFFSPA